MAREASFIEQKKDIEAIKKSRSKIGCGCKGTKGKSCDTKQCMCYKNEIECNESSCGCNNQLCKNPFQKHAMDDDMVNKFRKQTIKKANRLGKRIKSENK